MDERSAANVRFYDQLWSRSGLRRPELFNPRALVSSLAAEAPRRLEIGPGLCPRLPIEGTHFIDIGSRVVEHLRAAGGIAQTGDATHLPYADRRFDLVAGFDIIEHLPDELREMLGENELVIAQSAAFGMQPRSRWLASLAALFLDRHPVMSAACYDEVLLPLALRFQRPLRLKEGAMDMALADGVLLVCRRGRIGQRGEQPAAGS